MSTTSSTDAARAISRDDVRAVFAHIAETCDLPPMPAAAARALGMKVQEEHAVAGFSGELEGSTAIRAYMA